MNNNEFDEDPISLSPSRFRLSTQHCCSPPEKRICKGQPSKKLNIFKTQNLIFTYIKTNNPTVQR